MNSNRNEQLLSAAWKTKSSMLTNILPYNLFSYGDQNVTCTKLMPHGWGEGWVEGQLPTLTPENFSNFFHKFFTLNHPWLDYFNCRPYHHHPPFSQWFSPGYGCDVYNLTYYTTYNLTMLENMYIWFAYTLCNISMLDLKVMSIFVLRLFTAP